MDDSKPAGRRLTKKPPHPGVVSPALPSLHSFDNGRYDNQSLHSQRSSGSLQRSASTASPYPRSYNAAGHVRTGTTPAANFTSSNTSLDHQIASGPFPSIGGSSSDLQAPAGQYAPSGQQFSIASRPLTEKTSQELVGAPFDASGVFNKFDSTKATGFQSSQRRPPPPPLSHTAPADPRAMTTPNLRSSASYSANEKQTPRVGENQLISPKRYSDETRDPKLRKKSGFSNFINGLVGSPRRIDISAPANPVHVTHVGYDNQTGQFTVSGTM